MKKVLAGFILTAMLFACGSAFAGDFSSQNKYVRLEEFRANPNDQVLITLLSMVMRDLEMCGASLQGRFVDNLLSIGHLNNAQSALKRTNLDPAYGPLLGEIYERIGKIKFYIVMSDLPNVQMRLNQLISVIRAVMGAQEPRNGGVVHPQGGYNPPIYTPPYNPERPPDGFTPNGSPVTPNGGYSNLVPVNN